MSDSEYLDQIENMARQHCFTDKQVRTYNGVRESNITDSGGTSTDADALRTLAKHGRFRIVRDCGRMVVGYWPENDPNNTTPLLAEPLTMAEAGRIAQIILDAWKEADHLLGMYNGDFRWAIERLTLPANNDLSGRR